MTSDSPNAEVCGTAAPKSRARKSWPISHKTSLILSPTSDLQHISNLVLFAAEPDLLLEKEYRSHFPQVSHTDFIRITNHPAFWEAMNREMRSQFIVDYKRIIRSYVEMAVKGNISAAEFVLKRLLPELRPKEDEDPYQDFVGAISQAMAISLGKRRAIKEEPPPMEAVKVEILPS